MDVIVVLEPESELSQDIGRIGANGDARVIALDGLTKASAIPLSGMISSALWCRPFFENGDMVSPSGTRGAGSTKVRAGRRQTLGCEPDLVTWPPLATGPDAL